MRVLACVPMRVAPPACQRLYAYAYVCVPVFVFVLVLVFVCSNIYMPGPC